MRAAVEVRVVERKNDVERHGKASRKRARCCKEADKLLSEMRTAGAADVLYS